MGIPTTQAFHAMTVVTKLINIYQKLKPLCLHSGFFCVNCYLYCNNISLLIFIW
jgi:hypothetical protein